MGLKASKGLTAVSGSSLVIFWEGVDKNPSGSFKFTVLGRVEVGLFCEACG